MKRRQGISVLLAAIISGACQHDVASAEKPALALQPSKAASQAPAVQRLPAGDPNAPMAAPQNAAMARNELVSLLLEPNIARATLEQTQERFAKAASLARSSIVPEVSQLKGSTNTYSITINYGQDGKGGWLFSNLRVELRPGQGETQSSVYKECDTMLRAKLKKPRWSVPGSSDLPRAAYRVGKKLELILSACKGDDGQAAACLELGEPQGEPS
jgi:hypothetical protein